MTTYMYIRKLLIAEFKIKVLPLAMHFDIFTIKTSMTIIPFVVILLTISLFFNYIFELQATVVDNRIDINLVGIHLQGNNSITQFEMVICRVIMSTLFRCSGIQTCKISERDIYSFSAIFVPITSHPRHIFYLELIYKYVSQ